jgi:hypothetical protein
MAGRAVLLAGPPGTGKSMTYKIFVSIGYYVTKQLVKFLRIDYRDKAYGFVIVRSRDVIGYDWIMNLNIQSIYFFEFSN